MDITIKDGDTFRKLINCVKDLITDSGKIFFTKKGMYMQSIDTFNVILVDILFTLDAFESYKIESDFFLVFNFENFYNILKLSKDDKIRIIYKTGENKICIKFNEVKKKIQFNMNLSETDKEDREVPEIEYSVKVYMNNSEFQKTIKDISTFGKKCTIKVCDNDIFFSINGDTGMGDICISETEIEYTDSEKKEFFADFNVKYLNQFSKANLSDEITLKFADGIPFCFEYTLSYGHVRFYLPIMLSE